MYVLDLCAVLTLDLIQCIVSLHFASVTRRFMKAMVVAYASGLPAAVGDSLVGSMAAWASVRPSALASICLSFAAYRIAA